MNHGSKAGRRQLSGEPRATRRASGRLLLPLLLLLILAGPAAAQDFTLDVAVQGAGSVARNPDLPSYAAGSIVELTASPQPGWVFDHWEGDLSGGQNPIALTLDADKSVTAVFVPDGSDVVPPVISNIQVLAGSGSATIQWNTDEPASSAVDYGMVSGALDLRIESAALRTQHVLVVGGLSPDTVYFFEVVSADASGNVASSGESSFPTAPAGAGAGIESDDFSSVAVDPARWTFVDPLGDATVRQNGTQLVIDVAANATPHDFWTSSNDVPRLLQNVGDADFQVEARFESSFPDPDAFRSVGIAVEQTELDGLRIELHQRQGALNLFAASLFGGQATVHVIEPVPLVPPLHLRVTRSGDVFGVDYSADGASWISGATFVQPMNVARVGVYAGSDVDTAHTAAVDYFFDTASPIVPEDGNPSALVVATEGDGSVARDPLQTHYTAGQSVELTAVPAPGWQFDAWSGDVSSTANPLALTLGASTQVTALFSKLPDQPPLISAVQVAPSWSVARITWSTDEPSTSIVRYGTESGVYAFAESDSTQVTAHDVTLSGLSPDTDYFFEIESVDVDGNSAVDGERSFTTFADEAGIVSDDFEAATLDLGVWSFEDPLGDAAAGLDGGRLSISMDGVPGEVHDVWCCSNTLPRLMQAANDADFQVSARFDSPLPVGEFSGTGILVEETSANVVRAEFYLTSSGTGVFVASIFDGVPVVQAIEPVALGTPRHLRITRLGDLFQVEYGSDGVVWTEAASFQQPMTVTRVGPYAGSGAGEAHTALVDSFLSSGDPLGLPEPASGLVWGVVALALLARRRRLARQQV